MTVVFLNTTWLPHAGSLSQLVRTSDVSQVNSTAASTVTSEEAQHDREPELLEQPVSEQCIIHTIAASSQTLRGITPIFPCTMTKKEKGVSFGALLEDTMDNGSDNGATAQTLHTADKDKASVTATGRQSLQMRATAASG